MENLPPDIVEQRVITMVLLLSSVGVVLAAAAGVSMILWANWEATPSQHVTVPLSAAVFTGLLTALEQIQFIPVHSRPR
jgi:predicted permease